MSDDLSKAIISAPLLVAPKKVVMTNLARVTSIPNVHRLVSDGFALLECEMVRLKQKSALEGLTPNETKQFLDLLKALELLSAREDAISSKIGNRSLNDMSDEELKIFAQAALNSLGDSK